MAEDVTVTIHCSFAWWWSLCWPLTLLAVRLGVPVNPDRVVANAMAALKMEVRDA